MADSTFGNLATGNFGLTDSNNNINWGNVASGIGQLGGALMSLGVIGGNSAKTDRGDELAGRQGEWNLYNFGLQQGTGQQLTGQSGLNNALRTLDPVQAFYQRRLNPGRTDVAMMSAPGIDAALSQAGAADAQAAAFGGARTGGTAAAAAERHQQTQATIDQIINQNFLGGQNQAAAGLAGVSGLQAQIADSQLRNSLQLLGLSGHAIDQILWEAGRSRELSQNLHDSAANKFSNLANMAGGALNSLTRKKAPGGGSQQVGIPAGAQGPPWWMSPQTVRSQIGGLGESVSSNVTYGGEGEVWPGVNSTTTLDPNEQYPGWVPMDPNVPVTNGPGGYPGFNYTGFGNDPFPGPGAQNYGVPGEGGNFWEGTYGGIVGGGPGGGGSSPFSDDALLQEGYPYQYFDNGAGNLAWNPGSSDSPGVYGDWSDASAYNDEWDYLTQGFGA